MLTEKSSKDEKHQVNIQNIRMTIGNLSLIHLDKDAEKKLEGKEEINRMKNPAKKLNTFDISKFEKSQKRYKVKVETL